MTPSAYSALHAAIVAGELSPGERLVEKELAERLGAEAAMRAQLTNVGAALVEIAAPERVAI